MAATKFTPQLGVSLLKISELLTEADVQNLTHLYNEKYPEKCETFTNPKEFISALRSHKIIGEKNVDILITWLDNLKLSEASSILKAYKTLQFQDDHKKERCLIHKDEDLIYFCVSCDLVVCPECVISTHKNLKCDIFKLSHIEEELSKRKKQIISEIESTRKIAESVEKITIEKTNYIAKCEKDMQSKVARDCTELVENILRTKQTLLEEVERKTTFNLNQLSKARARHSGLSSKLDHLSKIKTKSIEHTPEGLKELKEMLKQITDIEKNFEEEAKFLSETPFSILCRRVHNNAAFCSIEEQTLIGSVALTANQLLQIFDQRKTKQRILFVCSDYKQERKDSWNYSMDIDNKYDPVVMSSLTMFFDSKHHSVFAVGRKVFVAKPRGTLVRWDTIETISSVVIDEVPESSWITSVSAHYPSGSSYQEFLISTNVDYVIREYDVTGRLLRVIDTEPTLQAPELLKVAYCENTFAIIDNDRCDPKLMKVKDGVKKYSSLVYNLSNMAAIDILWTGSSWLALFSTMDKERKWAVVNFDSEGKLLQVCTEGVSPAEMSVPINITRWSYTGFVTFYDNNIHKFKYGNDSLDQDVFGILDSLIAGDPLLNNPFFSYLYGPRI